LLLTRVRRAPPRYWLVLVTAALLIGLPSVVTSFQRSQWTLVLIFAIAIMGLNVLVGYSGQISLGHGAFMALGAYTSAILMTRYHLNYLVTIPIAGIGLFVCARLVTAMGGRIWATPRDDGGAEFGFALAELDEDAPSGS